MASESFLETPAWRPILASCTWCRPHTLFSIQLLVIATITTLSCFQFFPRPYTIIAANKGVMMALTQEEGCSHPFYFSILFAVLLEIMQVRQAKISDFGLFLFTVGESLYMIDVTVHYYRHWNEGLPLCFLLAAVVCLFCLGNFFESLAARFRRCCWGAIGLLCALLFLASQMQHHFTMWTRAVIFPIAMCLTLGVVLESSSQKISLSGGITGVIIDLYLALARRFLVLVLLFPYGKDGDEEKQTVDVVPSPPPSPRKHTSTNGSASLDFTNESNIHLHDEIPPSHWCVTKKDVQQFVAEVKKAWLDGEIPDSEPRNPHHDDPNVGPSMYQVNEHFIKPKTMARGGCSYALMVHPRGTPAPCDLFVTHAWAEGIFEFGKKLLNNWPAGCTYVWCCFLANPQNGDIGNLIGDDVLESPFAKALERAKKMIVLPNCSVSIYERMWCVLEAKLAMERKIDIIIPTAATTRRLLTAAIRGCVLLLVGAATSSCALASVCTAPILSQFLLLVICHSMVTLGKRLYWKDFQDVCCTTVDARALMLGFASGGGFQWLLTERLSCNSSRVSALRPLAWAIICAVPLGIEWTIRQFRRDILAKEALQLEFTSVKDARCANREDRERIRAAMHGQEHEIDGMINNLRAIGEFNARVRAELALGCDPSNRHHFSWSLLGSVNVLFGVCFAGNAAEVCGPRGFSGPPTLFGYWESKLPKLPGFSLSREPAAIAFSSVIFIASAFLYAFTRRPRYYHTAMFVEVYGIVMFCYVFTFFIWEKLHDNLYLDWRDFELGARTMAYFKIYSYLGAIMSGQILTLVWSPSIFNNFIVKTAHFMNPLFTVALGAFASGFEGCVDACGLHVEYVKCIDQCARPTLRIILVTAAVIVTACILGSYVATTFFRGHGVSKAAVDDGEQVIELQSFDRVQYVRSTVEKLSTAIMPERKASDLDDRELCARQQSMASNRIASPKSSKRYWTFVTCLCIISSSGLVGGWIIMPRSYVTFNRFIVRNEISNVLLTANAEKAVLSQETLVMIAATSTGRVLNIMRGHTSNVTCVALSEDETMVATGSYDGTSALWGVSNGNMIWRPNNFVLVGKRKSFVCSIALDRTASKLLIGGSRQFIEIFDIAARESYWRGFANLSREAHFRDNVSFTGFVDGSTFITGAQFKEEPIDSVVLWQVTGKDKEGQLLHVFDIKGKLQKAAISGDSSKLVTATLVDDDTQIQLWDIQSRKVLMDMRQREISPHGFSCLAISSHGSKVIVGTKNTSHQEASLHILDSSTGHVVSGFEYNGSALSTAISADSNFIAVGSDDMSMYVYDVKSRTMRHRFQGHASVVLSVSITADGAFAITRNNENMCHLWDVRSGQVVHNITADHQAITPDARYYLLAHAEAHGQQVWVTPRGGYDSWQMAHAYRQILIGPGSEEYHRLVRYLGISKNGKFAFVVYQASISLHDVQSGKIVRQFFQSTADDEFTCGQISQDNALMVGGTEIGTSIVWDVATGKRVHEFRYVGHQCSEDDHGEYHHRQKYFRPVRAVKFSSDSSMLIVAHGGLIVQSFETAATLWSMNEKKVMHTFCKNLGGVRAVSFGADDSLVLITPLWGDIRLHATRTGQQLKRYFSRKQHLDAALSSEMVVASSESGFVIWHRRTGMLLHTHRDSSDRQLGWLDERA